MSKGSHPYSYQSPDYRRPWSICSLPQPCHQHLSFAVIRLLPVVCPDLHQLRGRDVQVDPQLEPTDDIMQLRDEILYDHWSWRQKVLTSHTGFASIHTQQSKHGTSWHFNFVSSHMTMNNFFLFTRRILLASYKNMYATVLYTALVEKLCKIVPPKTSAAKFGLQLLNTMFCWIPHCSHFINFSS